MSSILDKPRPKNPNFNYFCEGKTLLWFPQEVSLALGSPQDMVFPKVLVPAGLGLQRMLHREGC